MAEQIQLKHKEVLKHTKYRSRILSTSQRNHASSVHSVSPDKFRGKMSTPHLELGEQRGDELEPWRYNEEPHMQYVHLRRL